MANSADIRVGTAGWSIPGATASRFDSAGTHLERYSRRLDCAEINSSFHRPHAATTYAKWRESTPPDFRFAVKIPRAITHVQKLREAHEPFVTFLAQTDGLADKRGPLLLQLPPSLSFDGRVVRAFLDEVRRVYDGPMVCEPRHATWFSQQARQVTWTLAERPERVRFLIRDRDQKFTNRFDDVFRGDGIEIVRTPFRVPQANGVAERFVRTARSECLDWMLIQNQRHLERVLEVFVTHYNEHRPHRALSLVPPEPRRAPVALSAGEIRVDRRDRLGGVLHEYVLAA